MKKLKDEKQAHCGGRENNSILVQTDMNSEIMEAFSGLTPPCRRKALVEEPEK